MSAPILVPNQFIAAPHLDDATLDALVRQIRACVEPEMIVLFGSHVYGEPRADSDVDLFVMMESGRAEPAGAQPLVGDKAQALRALA